MSFQLPIKGTADQPNEPTSAVKAEPKSDSLNVSFGGGIRAPSPSPSLISIDEFNNVRLGRDPDYVPAPNGHRYALQSPAARPRSLKAKLAVFWNTNKGLALVMISQICGTLMNVTTRLLEVEGNHGKGYHPFQVLMSAKSCKSCTANCK
jgi:hypothetical protein